MEAAPVRFAFGKEHEPGAIDQAQMVQMALMRPPKCQGCGDWSAIIG